MEAIILVGGKGMRLRSVVSDVPKPLAPVDGVPFTDHLLKKLPTKSIIFSVGYLAQKIIDYYQGDPCIKFSVETEPLGTGGGARKAVELASSDTVWVLNGDSYFDIDFEEMLRQHFETEADITLACRQVEDSSRYGSLRIEGKQLRAFEEKRPGAGWINGGIYLMKKELLIQWPLNTPLSLEKEVFPELLLSDKAFFVYPSEGKFIDIGTPESYSQAKEIVIA
ncbi:MAG: NTP transferase domain-containing protein [Chlamydiales bacterium]|nr:NTP transferase domain-containing protein [Chlamydiales bacterium]